MSGPNDISDAEHDRALHRAFELRHPMLAFGLRMMRRRPLTGTISALAFLAASFILVNAGILLEKRISVWLDVNYVGAWEGHDRAATIRKGVDDYESRRVAEDGSSLTIPPGHKLPVYFEHDGTSLPAYSWGFLPDFADDNEFATPEMKHLGSFTLLPGQQIALFHFANHEGRAETTISGQAYWLVHAMWWTKAEPWKRAFPADFSKKDRELICPYGLDKCEIWGLVKLEDLEAAGLHG